MMVLLHRWIFRLSVVVLLTFSHGETGHSDQYTQHDTEIWNQQDGPWLDDFENTAAEKTLVFYLFI